MSIAARQNKRRLSPNKPLKTAYSGVQIPESAYSLWSMRTALRLNLSGTVRRGETRVQIPLRKKKLIVVEQFEYTQTKQVQLL